MRDLQRRVSLASAALGSETLLKRERQFVAFCLQQATNANAFSVKFELKGKRLGASIYISDPFAGRAELYQAGREPSREPAATQRPADGPKVRVAEAEAKRYTIPQMRKAPKTAAQPTPPGAVPAKKLEPKPALTPKLDKNANSARGNGNEDGMGKGGSGKAAAPTPKASRPRPPSDDVPTPGSPNSSPARSPPPKRASRPASEAGEDSAMDDVEEDPPGGDSSRRPDYPLGVPYYQNGMIYTRRKVSDG